MPRKRIWFLVVVAALLGWLRPWRALTRRLRADAPAGAAPSPGELLEAWRAADAGAPAAPHPEAAFDADAGPAYSEADAERLGAILDRNASALERAAHDDADALGLDAGEEGRPAEFAGPDFFGPGAPDDERALEAAEAGASAPRRRPDDLLVIEGIGPRTSTIVTAAGYTSFADLATADVERLKQALRDAGIRTIDPSTWPEQARLADEGRWDELRALQQRIRNGRIVG